MAAGAAGVCSPALPAARARARRDSVVEHVIRGLYYVITYNAIYVCIYIYIYMHIYIYIYIYIYIMYVCQQ